MLLLLPLFIFSQNKKKKALAEKLAIANLIANLKLHTQSIIADSTTSANYLVSQFYTLGLVQDGESGYLDPFIINNGKQIKNCSLVVQNKEAVLFTDYFPLPYSGTGSIKTFAAMSMNEPGNCWFKDIKDWLEEANSSTINVDSAIKRYIIKSVAKRATALFFYNSSKLADSIYFNKMDATKTVAIPVMYITKKGIKSLFIDKSATQSVEASVSIVDNLSMGFNTLFALDNHASTTIIISTTNRISGIPVMIELAKKLSISSTKSTNFRFVYFHNNDSAKLGSTYYIDKHIQSNPPSCMVNIGDVSTYSNKLIADFNSSDSIINKSLVDTHNKNIGVQMDSTHTPFLSNLSNTLSYVSFHTDTSTTNTEINYQGEMDIVNYLYALITSMSNAK